ncbi:hypothetical protein SELMODRAFT_423293 [Selaginella moellendorffii]|uniref:Uncharacterized protein n=1 Tax=Selaginella moellendorffii TaxID=88036 RepID=D8SL73_SELML|nr:hypothetical protein SELMODRAFT_423293 [Selaginella moellendorffii]
MVVGRTLQEKVDTKVYTRSVDMLAGKEEHMSSGMLQIATSRAARAGTSFLEGRRLVLGRIWLDLKANCTTRNSPLVELVAEAPGRLSTSTTIAMPARDGVDEAEELENVTKSVLSLAVRSTACFQKRCPSRDVNDLQLDDKSVVSWTAAYTRGACPSRARPRGCCMPSGRNIVSWGAALAAHCHGHKMPESRAILITTQSDAGLQEEATQHPRLGAMELQTTDEMTQWVGHDCPRLRSGIH